MVRRVVRDVGRWRRLGRELDWLCDAELEDLEGAVAEVEVLAGGLGEVDEDVGALGGGEVEALSGTGAASSPWSEPIWWKGCWLESERVKKRLLAALSTRKR